MQRAGGMYSVNRKGGEIFARKCKFCPEPYFTQSRKDAKEGKVLLWCFSLRLGGLSEHSERA
ncbi:MAG: hypothetical protein BA869_03365 [Desulfuromonadales bacterium C00003107]|jgi:hypothetical protein|nr:MAG: hypothetical protein BA869_03365 [Desulfuromonadales bacterium C00003107]